MKKSVISGMFMFFVIFIIALIFLVVATLLVKMGAQNQVETLDNTQCKQSNQMLANLILTPDETGTTGISLVTEEINENCPIKFSEVTSKDTNKINEALASSLANCWDSYLEGKEAIFPKDTGAKSICAICEIIDFSEVQNVKSEELMFGDYLNEHKSNIDPTKTYAQYLGIGNGGIETFNSYIKIYPKTAIVYYSTQDVKTLEEIMLGGGAAATGIGTTGAIAVAVLSGPVGWITAGVVTAGLGITALIKAEDFQNIIRDFDFQPAYIIVNYENPDELSRICGHIISGNIKEPEI